jgi:TRAP-type C4-dicarboxylate transport system substrate-binding protein
MKRSIQKGGLIFCLAVFIAAIPLIGDCYAASGKVYKWKWVGSIPKSLPHMSIWEDMCKEIGERSKGRLVVRPLHLGEHPYGGKEILSVVRDGLVEMGQSEGVYVTGEEVFMGAMDLPFLIPTMDKAVKIKDRWVSELLDDYLKKEWNQFVLSMWLVAGEAVHSNKLLDNFEALKGQKIRVWSKETADLVKKIGGTPVTVAMKETLTSLEKGIIDGGLTSIYAAYAFKWYEIVKYSTWWNFSFPSDFTVVNYKAYNELPADLQSVLVEVGKKYEQRLQTELEAYTYWCAAMGITHCGVTIGGLSPKFHSLLKERVKPITEDWVKRCPGDLGERFMKIAEEELKKK